MKNSNRYLISFLIASLFFVLAFWGSSKIAQDKLNTVQQIQNKIATDILSSETRFALLRTSTCEHVVEDNDFERQLTSELNDFARRVKFMESQVGQQDERLINLKEQYSLLQIKDLILIRELATRCGTETVTVLSFHDLNCEDCNQQSIVLDELHDRRPEIRIYWFDRSLNTPAMQTLLSMFKIKDVPSVVINDKTYSGFQSLEELEGLLPPAPAEEEVVEQKEITQ